MRLEGVTPVGMALFMTFEGDVGLQIYFSWSLYPGPNRAPFPRPVHSELTNSSTKLMQTQPAC